MRATKSAAALREPAAALQPVRPQGIRDPSSSRFAGRKTSASLPITRSRPASSPANTAPPGKPPTSRRAAAGSCDISTHAACVSSRRSTPWPRATMRFRRKSPRLADREADHHRADRQRHQPQATRGNHQSAGHQALGRGCRGAQCRRSIDLLNFRFHGWNLDRGAGVDARHERTRIPRSPEKSHGQAFKARRPERYQRGRDQGRRGACDPAHAGDLRGRAPPRRRRNEAPRNFAVVVGRGGRALDQFLAAVAGDPDRTPAGGALAAARGQLRLLHRISSWRCFRASSSSPRARSPRFCRSPPM